MEQNVLESVDTEKNQYEYKDDKAGIQLCSEVLHRSKLFQQVEYLFPRRTMYNLCHHLALQLVKMSSIYINLTEQLSHCHEQTLFSNHASAVGRYQFPFTDGKLKSETDCFIQGQSQYLLSEVGNEQRSPLYQNCTLPTSHLMLSLCLY